MSDFKILFNISEQDLKFRMEKEDTGESYIYHLWIYQGDDRIHCAHIYFNEDQISKLEKLFGEARLQRPDVMVGATA